MYKDNEIMKLAHASLTKNKRAYRYVSWMIILSFFVCVAYTITIFSYQTMEERERDQRYGSWIQYDGNLTKEALETYQQASLLDHLGIVDIAGMVEMKEANYGVIGNFNQDMEKIANLTFIEGRFPKDASEIVIEQSTLQQLGYDEQKLHDTITITYIQNEQTITRAFTLVGIIEDYTNSWEVVVPSFITRGLEYTTQSAFLQADQHLKFTNENMYTELTLNQKRYPSLDLHVTLNEDGVEISRYEENLPDTTSLLNEILLVMMLGIFGATISMNRKRRDEIIMLRRIGATNYQILKLLVYEGCLLTIKKSILGSILGVIVATLMMLCMSSFYHVQFILTVDMMELLFHLIVCIVIIFMLMGLSFVDIVIISINGSVDKPKRTRMKKYNRSRYLSVRQLAFKNMQFYKGIYILLAILFLTVELRCLQTFKDDQWYQQQIEMLEQQKTYDYCVMMNGLKDMSTYTSELTKNNIDVGIEKLSSFGYQVQWPNMVMGTNNGQVTVPYSYFRCIEQVQNNQEALQKRLKAGRMPTNDYEVLAYIPDGYIIEGFEEISFGYGSGAKENELTYVSDNALQVGNEVSVYQILEDESQVDIGTLTVVGIVQEVIDLPDEYPRLVNKEYGDVRAFYVNENTFRLLALEGYQKVYIRCPTTKMQNLALQNINQWKYELGDEIDSVYHNANEINNQLQDVQINRMKNMGISLSVTAGLIIIFRIVARTVAENEKKYMAIYKAIGMSQNQIYQICIMESIFMILPSILIFVLQMFLYPNSLQSISFLQMLCMMVVTCLMIVLFVSSYYFDNTLKK